MPADSFHIGRADVSGATVDSLAHGVGFKVEAPTLYGNSGGCEARQIRPQYEPIADGHSRTRKTRQEFVMSPGQSRDSDPLRQLRWMRDEAKTAERAERTQST